MKTFSLIIIALASNLVFAYENPRFESCSSQDIKTLETAHTRFGGIKNVIREELLPMESRCLISKPRMIHPAVCGIRITQIDTFQFLVGRNGARYEVKIDSSYTSCQDLSALIVPEIREFKFIDPKILPNL